MVKATKSTKLKTQTVMSGGFWLISYYSAIARRTKIHFKTTFLYL